MADSTKLAGLISDLLRCERGATVIEYTMIAGFIALVIAATVRLVGSENAAGFDDLPDVVR
ncbi:MAG: Flp family type IVb pilin [Hyphomicrobiaceae bacterium]|nr:Flp family type IVb pilin [Hyphomicrobiaceae bacterium]